MRGFALLAVISVFLLFAGCIAQPSPAPSPPPAQVPTAGYNVPDATWTSGNINTTGLKDTIYLVSARSAHVFTITGSQGLVTNVSTAFINMTGARTCTNNTVVTGGGCANTTTIAAGNFTLTEVNSTMSNATFSTNNVTLNSSSLLNIRIIGGDIAVRNNTNSTYIGVLHRTGFYNTFGNAYILPWNTTGTVNITGLDPYYYVINGVVTVSLQHFQNGSDMNGGAYVDYVSIDGTYNATNTGTAALNATMLGSIDCVNWFTQATMTNVAAPVMSQVNNTLTCVAFNVTSVNVGAGGYFNIKYVGVT